uniref:F-box protein 40, tandem duplicate 1 n=1 Tax=Eptatretus burgeri TaxID=7764 RepID=A0A8C4N2S8_EPTBU
MICSDSSSPIHSHCSGCVSRRCRFIGESGNTTCPMVACMLGCGARFHMCKKPEHACLCPLDRVPCINQGYGCPLTMARHRLAQHLQSCSASIVHCSMEWNRWPVTYADRGRLSTTCSGADPALHLDLALARRDQKILMVRLPTSPVLPETFAIHLWNKAKAASDFDPTGDVQSRKVMEEHNVGAFVMTTEPKACSDALEHFSRDEGSNDSLRCTSTVSKGSAVGEKEEIKHLVENGASVHGDCNGGLCELRQATAEMTQSLSAALAAVRLNQVGLENKRPAALGPARKDPELQRFSTWEHIFSKDHTAKTLQSKSPDELRSADAGMGGIPTDGAKPFCIHNDASVNGPRPKAKAEEDGGLHTDEQVGQGESGLAPWQDGVLDRMSHELDSDHYNLYLSQQGSMLIRFGQMHACTPRHEDFVYGGLESQEVRTVSTFKAPTSFHRKRTYLGDYGTRFKVQKAQGVDTKDLNGAYCESDKASALLHCLEAEARSGHSVSEPSSVDGHLMHVGTQTYPTLFGPCGVLAVDEYGQVEINGDNLDDWPQLLDLVHNCTLQHPGPLPSLFSFRCAHTFRRDEYTEHFAAIHVHVQPGLLGWTQQRCPLACYGCNFTQQRFCPDTPNQEMVYLECTDSFAIRSSASCPSLDSNPYAIGLDDLPFEVQRRVAAFLDPGSLARLSLVSRNLRAVCASLLRLCGMVEMCWEPRAGQQGGWREAGLAWKFSTAISPVRTWTFSPVPSMAQHLAKCPYYILAPPSPTTRVSCVGFAGKSAAWPRRKITLSGRAVSPVFGSQHDCH